MPGDYSRFTFDPLEDFFGVLMQQGRVMLDSDLNELVAEFERQFRVRMLDTVGRCVVPRETLSGFQIQIAGDSLTIGRGRVYVHGLLAENHGGDQDGVPVTAENPDDLEYYRILEEQRGLFPIAFEHQPYLPNAGGLLTEELRRSPLLVYLDVWKREVTHVQQPELVEKAVGVDTTTRVQVVWQVKVFPVPQGTTCATPAENIPGWLELTAPPAARLSTNAVGVPASDDPCIISPNGGFRGTENRLYRVEVHEGGPALTATFKWSRDNASVKTAVRAINGGLDVLTVTRIGRDRVSRFAPGDWIEVIDDHLELTQSPGQMRKVLSLDEVNQTITLESALPAGVFDALDPSSGHTRIRRWDQRGAVLDASNNTIDDVDANGGVIRVSAGGGTIVLEDGVEVTFSETPTGGVYRTGDHWCFAARTVDASVERLVEAPPRGIIHHYCRLAIVLFPEQVLDCRTFWPPEFGEGGCDCTECVSAESHNSGVFTIQMAIDRVSALGGKVCLGPGLFSLGADPVVLSGARSVQIEGHGLSTVLVYLGSGPAVRVSACIDVNLSRLSVVALALRESGSMAVLIQNSFMARVERCALVQFGLEGREGLAVGLNGLLFECRITDNLMFGAAGVHTISADLDDPSGLGKLNRLENGRSYTLTFGLYIEDNLIVGLRRGIGFANLTLHLGDSRIANNQLFGSREVTVLSAGFTLAPVLRASRVDICENTITTSGSGIAFATDNTRVWGNDIGGVARSEDQPLLPSNIGVVIEDGLVSKEVERAHILTNRITGLGGDAIQIRTHVSSGMIKQNFIEDVAGGIVMTNEATADVLVIENNQLRNVGTVGVDRGFVSAIRTQRAQKVTVSNNEIDGFAERAAASTWRVAIEVLGASQVRITGNVLNRIAADEFSGTGAGIRVVTPADDIEISGNSVDRGSDPSSVFGSSSFTGILVSGVGVFPGLREELATELWRETMFIPFDVTAADSAVLVLGASFLAVVPAAQSSASVRGNSVRTTGSAPAISAVVTGPMSLSDNRCRLAASGDSKAVVASAAGFSVVTHSNQLERTPSSDAAIALSILAQKPHFTVLGNYCRGGTIRVNLVPLDDPWAPLNVATF